MMLIDTHKQAEAVPTAVPVVYGLSSKAQALDPDPIWQRIEAFIVHRYVSRPVTWIIEGPGEWIPPLTPIQLDQAFVWTSDGWSLHDLDAGPIGLRIPSGMVKVEAIAGDDTDPPPAVQEAFRRYAEYLAATDESQPGASHYVAQLGPMVERVTRNPAHTARALFNSGAADLLRPYRRA